MKPILEAESITISSITEGHTVDIVKDVSFSLYPHETLALVGESGSGKTMTSEAFLRIPRAKNIVLTSGRVLFKGKDLAEFSEKEMQKVRGKKISTILQNPLNSLNPTLQVGTQLYETVAPGIYASKDEALSACFEMLELVGFSDAKRRFYAYPHELSGGMRQRLLIAMALINKPEVLIADEPTTALDVTIQAQILKLLQNLQQKLGMSILFITHDMGVVAEIAHRVIVMYAGQIVEESAVDTLFYHTKHPYTKALFSCLPRIDNEKKERLTPILGTPPQAGRYRNMCPFMPRCRYAMRVCAESEAALTKRAENHFVRCHRDE